MTTKITNEQIRGVLSGRTISATASASTLYTSLYVEPGNPIVIATGVVYTIDVPFDAGIYKVFDCQGTGTVVFAKGSIRTGYPQWWGLAESASSAVNAASLKAAIDSNLPIVEIPAGNYTYDNGLIFNRAIRFDGAGGVGAASSTGADGATPALTKFIYSGTGVGMTLQGTIADSTENIHLSNFLLYGNVLATGGIDLGVAGAANIITKGSLKNVKVSFFNKVANGYGIRFVNVLEFLLQNTYCNFNHLGMYSTTGDVATTCLIENSFTRENVADGVNLQGTFTGCTFLNHVSETNGAAGLYIAKIEVTYNTFINWWSENNNTTSGGSPIEIGTNGGTSPFGIAFYGGAINDDVAGVSVYILAANGCTFTNMVSVGAVKLLAGGGGVVNCRIEGPYMGTVTNNRIGAVRVDGVWEEELLTNAVTSMVLPVTSGTIYVNTKNNNQWYAIYGLFGGTGNVVEQLDPGTHYQTTAPADNAGTIGIYHNGASSYLIKNATVGTLTMQLRA